MTLAMLFVLLSGGAAVAMIVAPELAVRWMSVGLETAGESMAALGRSLNPEKARTEVAYARAGSSLLVAVTESSDLARLQEVVDALGPALDGAGGVDALSVHAVVDEEGLFAALASDDAGRAPVLDAIRQVTVSANPTPLELELTLQPSQRSAK